MEEKYRGRIIAIILIGLMIAAIYFSKILVLLISIAGILWYGGVQYDRISALYQKDPLTNVYNRQFVYEFLPNLFKKANKKKNRISIIFIDIDGFKGVNDSYGHLMGDNILIHLSEILQRNVRTTDRVVRWGGDEFIIIIPNCSNKDLNKIIGRLYCEVELLSTKLGFNISITLGTSTYPDDGLCVEDLIEKADFNMYLSKGKKLIKAVY